MRTRRYGRLSLVTLPLALLAAVSPASATAGLWGRGGHGVATVATTQVQTQQVQTNYIVATPVVTSAPTVAATPVVLARTPLFQRHPRAMVVSGVAVPATTASFVTTSAPALATSYIVQVPATVTTTAPTTAAAPQVTVSQSGQSVTLTINGAATVNQGATSTTQQGPIVESTVEAPYLTTLSVSTGGTVAARLKSHLRTVVQSGGPGALNLNFLLQEALKFLLGNFGGGFSFNWNQAIPEIINIINSLFNEQKNSGGGGGGGGGGGSGGGGGGTGNLAPGTYQIQGTITIASGANNGGNLSPLPPPSPSPSGVVINPADRDSNPSRSPFGTP